MTWCERFQEIKILIWKYLIFNMTPYVSKRKFPLIYLLGDQWDPWMHHPFEYTRPTIYLHLVIWKNLIILQWIFHFCIRQDRRGLIYLDWRNSVLYYIYERMTWGFWNTFKLYYLQINIWWTYINLKETNL